MAVGDLVLRFSDLTPPDTSAATLSERLGGSTPKEVGPIWEFGDGTAEYIDLKGMLWNYSGTGTIRVTVPYMAASGTTGTVILEGAFRRLDSAEDWDAAHTYSFQTVTDTVPATNGVLSRPFIDFTSAQIDGLQNGEPFIFRFRRNGGTLVGAAQFWDIWGEEV